MAMDEQSWRDVLGLSSTAGAAPGTEDPDGSGETAQETAAPAETEERNENTGGDTSSTASGPPSPQEEGMDEGSGAEEDPDNGDEPVKPRQSRAENARQARMRREREQQQAVEAAVAAERERLNGLIAQARLPDPTRRGEYITTADELDAVGRARAMRNAAKAMEDGGDLTPEQLTELMASTEAGRAMLDLVGQAEAAKAEAEAAQALTIRQQGVNQISKIDPTVKSFEDLSQAPEYDTFRAYVLENGLSWADAWRLAAADRLSRQAAQASRQRALNDISGKAHLSADAPKGGNGIDIPPSVEAAYRMMDPGISHDQALKKYAAYLKRTASTG